MYKRRATSCGAGTSAGLTSPLDRTPYHSSTMSAHGSSTRATRRSQPPGEFAAGGAGGGAEMAIESFDMSVRALPLGRPE